MLECRHTQNEEDQGILCLRLCAVCIFVYIHVSSIYSTYLTLSQAHEFLRSYLWLVGKTPVVSRLITCSWLQPLSKHLLWDAVGNYTRNCH